MDPATQAVNMSSSGLSLPAHRKVRRNRRGSLLLSGLVVVVVVVVVGGGDAYLLSAGARCSHMSGTAKRAVKGEGWTGCWRGGGAV